MPISTPAKISFPLDIPQVDVLATKQTRDSKFIITVKVAAKQLRMRSQITFDKETHPQGLPVHQNLKLKTGKP